MNKIFGDACDKYVEAVTLYYKSGDGMLYTKKTGSNYSDPIPAAELKNLFSKGMVLVDDGTKLIRPTTYADHTASGGKVDYSYVSLTTYTGSAAADTKYYSAGYHA